MTAPEELDALQAELRIIGCHSNGDARCTCSIGADADAAITALRARVAELEAENGILRRRAADQHKIMSAHLSNQRKTIKRLEIEATTRWHLLRQHHGESVRATKRAEKAEAELARIRAALVSPGDGSFQDRVQPWMLACFGAEISGDRLERGDRFLEEALELLQSGNYPKEMVAALTDYVWSREVGDPPQEVGGVMVTLAAYCLAHGLDMHTCGETELSRIWTKVEKIRAKQAAKPRGSALPVAPPASEDA